METGGDFRNALTRPSKWYSIKCIALKFVAAPNGNNELVGISPQGEWFGVVIVF